MRRILLLDDSANIQKVVKLTFSGDASCEVKIARNEDEAQVVLSEAKPDAVIAYVHFPKGDNVKYFLGVRKICQNILLLAESDVDVGVLVSAGFSQILRKPFVSSKLRADVLAFWGETAPASGLPVPGMPPPPPPPILHAAPPPPPIVPQRSTLETPVATPVRDASSDVPRDLFRTASFAPVDVPPISGSGLYATPNSRLPDAPEITMDLATLERTLRNTVAQPKEETFSQEPRFSFSDPGPVGISIDLSSSNDDIEIENVSVRAKSAKNVDAEKLQPSVLPADWHREMNEAIDDAVFRIIDRALPMKVDAKLAEIMPNIEEVVNKMRNEVSEKLMDALRAQVGDAVRKWLKDNLVVIAREEVRGEIQKLISEI